MLTSVYRVNGLAGGVVKNMKLHRHADTLLFQPHLRAEPRRPFENGMSTAHILFDGLAQFGLICCSLKGKKRSKKEPPRKEMGLCFAQQLRVIDRAYDSKQTCFA